ncbi:MAG: c-type heme family protein [Nitrospiraceae bacterium]
MKRSLVWGTVLVLLILVGGIAYWGIRAMLNGADQPVAIPPEKVADYVHAVIEANRTVYATNVVDKMQEKGIVEAAEHWRQENALPLPAQFLIDTGRLVAERGLGIKYRLASLSPIYVWNNAQSDFERKGLEAVAKNPERPYTGFIRIGRERFFQAVYADRAVAHACAECHNRHPNSPRRDYKLNDVMGGIVITIPAGP